LSNVLLLFSATVPWNVRHQSDELLRDFRGRSIK
jgi:hypothetical protein